MSPKIAALVGLASLLAASRTWGWPPEGETWASGIISGVFLLLVLPALVGLFLWRNGGSISALLQGHRADGQGSSNTVVAGATHSDRADLALWASAKTNGNSNSCNALGPSRCSVMRTTPR